MIKYYKKIIFLILFSELIFIFFISIFYDETVDLIFYLNTNFCHLIAFLCWINYKLGKVNRILILIWTVESIIVTLVSLIALVWRIYLTDSYIQFINIFIIIITLIDLFKTLYIFFLVIFSTKPKVFLLKTSIIFLFLIAIIFYSKFILYSTDLSIFNFAYSENYIVYILNFSLLSVFWIHYMLNKIIFSEYISNILTVHTIIVALEILYSFSVQNDGYLHALGQYFNAILNLILIVLWSVRIVYLYKPESIENEKYVKNYSLLQGIVDRPQHGILYDLYIRLNKTSIILALIFLLAFSIYIFYFNDIRIFIKLNILLLILATIISMILAILTWYKRWYDSVGFFFRKRKK